MPTKRVSKAEMIRALNFIDPMCPCQPWSHAPTCRYPDRADPTCARCQMEVRAAIIRAIREERRKP